MLQPRNRAPLHSSDALSRRINGSLLLEYFLVCSIVALTMPSRSLSSPSSYTSAARRTHGPAKPPAASSGPRYSSISAAPFRWHGTNTPRTSSSLCTEGDWCLWSIKRRWISRLPRSRRTHRSHSCLRIWTISSAPGKPCMIFGAAFLSCLWASTSCTDKLDCQVCSS